MPYGVPGGAGVEAESDDDCWIWGAEDWEGGAEAPHN